MKSRCKCTQDVLFKVGLSTQLQQRNVKKNMCGAVDLTFDGKNPNEREVNSTFFVKVNSQRLGFGQPTMIHDSAELL